MLIHCLTLVIEKYKDKPDDYVLSIGDWIPADEHWPVPVFAAYLQLKMGNLREMKKRLGEADPAGRPYKGERTDQVGSAPRRVIREVTVVYVKSPSGECRNAFARPREAHEYAARFKGQKVRVQREMAKPGDPAGSPE